MKILIFGGTFNPVHIGHVEMCRAACAAVRADKVLVIPTFIPPHKSVGDELVKSEHRINMCRIAFSNDANTEISDIEIKRQGSSYTVQTLEQIERLYPAAELYLLCGADMFLTLHEWRDPLRIFDICTVCAVPRSGGDTAELHAYAMQHIDEGLKYIALNTRISDISSTQIRNDVDGNRKFLPDGVYDYIVQNNLYRK
jgi:nicotinate-nucleotide adenylyltransferase